MKESGFNLSSPEPFTSIIPNNASEEVINRTLIKHIFCLPPNYQRPNPVWTTSINIPPKVRSREEIENLEYDRYHIRTETAPNHLTDDNIQLEDIKMFSNKLRVLIDPLLIEQIKETRDFYQSKLKKVKNQLFHWSQLIENKPI